MQSVSPGFTAAAAAAGRRPVTAIEISWDGTGDIGAARGAAGWTDETAYLANHTGQLRLNAPGDELVPAGDVGLLTVVLHNQGGRFAWRRADGPLYAYIGGAAGLAGKLVRVWQGFLVSGSPEYVRVFTGVIEGWRELSGSASVELTARDLGAKYGTDRRSTAVAVDQRPDIWIDAVATLAGIASGNMVLDVAIFPIPYAWMDDEGVLDEIWETARADGGLAYFDQLGKLRFENLLHWATAPHLTPSWTFTEGDYVLSDPLMANDDLATRVIAEWSARYQGVLAAVYTLDSLKIVRPGETISWEARYSHPAVDVIDPVATTDYAAVSEGGTSMTASLTVTLLNQYGQRCTVSVVNWHSTLAARLTFFQIRGDPLIGGPTEQVSAVPASSPLAYERTRTVRGNIYVQTQAQGQALVNYLAARHSRMRPVYTLRGVPGVPQLELGDRVAFYDARALGAGATLEGYVVGIDWQSGLETGFTQDVRVLDATDLYPYDDYFIIGETALGAHGRCWY